ncbi:MAG: molybdopterin-dependent oxidoreductase [Anaerolineae bacterium]|nr:molybdopterin-dependent oxidoreductase [Anaerolineae bacterium]
MSTQTSSDKITRGACPHDCPDTCAWQVMVQNGTAIKLVGDSDHPFTRGVLCAKVDHYLERVYSPERILYPMRRVGAKGEGKFERVSWDEALMDISGRLQDIIAQNGPTAILPYSYMGTQGLIQRDAGHPFFDRLGTTRLVRNICGSAGFAGSVVTNGISPPTLPEDIVHSRFIILWGTNTVVTNLHLWPFIQQARKNGATLVVIDPAKTRTAAQADWHVQPLPGTDAALALGMMHVIVQESLYDADYVERYTLGFEPLRERLTEYPPERAAQITGLEADEIIKLAKAYATTRPTAIRTLIGLEHHSNGAMMHRTIKCLPALVGAWRERGGGIIGGPAEAFFRSLNIAAVRKPELEDQNIRSVNMVQLGQALTSHELDPPIRSLIVHSSNPAAIAPNQNLVLQGLRREDLFTVVHEQFLTDTARSADYVLPATTQLEHADLLWSWGHKYLTLNQPAIEPLGEAVPNTEFFRRLAASLGLEDAHLFTSDEERIRTLLTSDHPYLDGISYEQLEENGWAPLNLPADYCSLAEGGFATPSGKCEFYAESLIAQGLDPLPTHVPPKESPVGDPELARRYPLMLLTAKSALHFLNSSYANLPRHLKAEGAPHLDLHMDDAVPRDIRDGDQVRVYNDRGEVKLRARVGNRIRTGVVSMPSGWWASLSPGGSSANALTADGLSDLGGGGDFHDTLVEVEKVMQPVVTG